jgi:hypothetical protein
VTTLSVVLPTIDGREDELARTIETYERLTPVPIEWIVETGYQTAGQAWNAMVPKATGEIVHLAADDLEPETDGWFPAALIAIEQGNVPMGWVREDEAGTFGRDFCRVWAGRRDWWEPVLETHYYSDDSLTDLMRAAGHLPVIAEGFDFYHRRSMVGRLETPERMYADHVLYDRWLSERR